VISAYEGTEHPNAVMHSAQLNAASAQTTSSPNCSYLPSTRACTIRCRSIVHRFVKAVGAGLLGTVVVR